MERSLSSTEDDYRFPDNTSGGTLGGDPGQLPSPWFFADNYTHPERMGEPLDSKAKASLETLAVLMSFSGAVDPISSLPFATNLRPVVSCDSSSLAWSWAQLASGLLRKCSYDIAVTSSRMWGHGLFTTFLCEPDLPKFLVQYHLSGDGSTVVRFCAVQSTDASDNPLGANVDGSPIMYLGSQWRKDQTLIVFRTNQRYRMVVVNGPAKAVYWVDTGRELNSELSEHVRVKIAERLVFDIRTNVATDMDIRGWTICDNSAEARKQLGIPVQTHRNSSGPLVAALAILIMQGIRPHWRNLGLQRRRVAGGRAANSPDDYARRSVLTFFLAFTLQERDKDLWGGQGAERVNLLQLRRQLPYLSTAIPPVA